MNETILIVDDETAQLQAMGHAVRHKLNYQVVMVSSGEEAVRWVMNGGLALSSGNGGWHSTSPEAMAAAPLFDMQGHIKKLKSLEEEAIRFALQHAGGCMTRAAKNLGIGRSTLYRRVGELEISGYISRANQTTRPMTVTSPVERS